MTAITHASRQEFTDLFQRAEARRHENYDRFIDLALVARRSVTAEEWQAIHEAMQTSHGQ